MIPSPVRFAPSPGGRIAYRTLGEGPLDLVIYPTGAWNIDLVWDEPRAERWLRQLASFSRVILFNARGSGGSDPIPAGITLEDWALDTLRVLDALGVERASYLWFGETVVSGLLSAAAYPDRAGAIVAVDGYARLRRAPDYPFGMPDETLHKMDVQLVEMWGSGAVTRMLVPAEAADTRFLDWYGRFERTTASPAMFAVIRRMFGDSDVRAILPSVQAPTLVISHTDDRYIRRGHAQYLADHIPDAKLVERPGPAGIAWLTDVPGTLAEVQNFLTGVPSLPDIEDRFLAAVLFTDIVDSTSRAAALGDAAWRRLLDEHDRVLARVVERFRGRLIKSTGDGVLATFDGPARAIRCGLAMQAAAADIGLQIRVGLHAGEVEQRGDDVGGIAVAIAARVMAEAASEEVLVSSAVPPLVAGAGLSFVDRGSRVLKGVPGEWRVLAATAA
ncbi:MAG TPA: adenylate/guanylate cyclase domain-containing protein [Mycobacteriales bacterium]|nr:adenylate/guanylate cyclase domain-containing protein [Mycobacteriales bacterium]